MTNIRITKALVISLLHMCLSKIIGKNYCRSALSFSVCGILTFRYVYYWMGSKRPWAMLHICVRLLAMEDSRTKCQMNTNIHVIVRLISSIFAQFQTWAWTEFMWIYILYIKWNMHTLCLLRCFVFKSHRKCALLFINWLILD